MPGDRRPDRPVSGDAIDDDRIVALEAEHVDQLARAHEALAQAQDRSYWLDRWGVDLNAVMSKPGARRARTAIKALREIKRGAMTTERYVRARLDELRAANAEDDLDGQAQRQR